MQEMETTGRTVEEAIDKAVHQLGVALEDVEVVVVDRGRVGILGLGAEQARVRISVRAVVATVDFAKRTVEDLLRATGADVAVGLPERSLAQPGQENLNVLSFDIDGEDAGLLIGRRGETLGALQFIVNLILSKKTQNHVRASIDVAGYQERRNDLLGSMALRMAERAIAAGRSVAMVPMPARERRIVHMALSEYGRVTTESVGEGTERRVTIIPKRSAGAPRNTGVPPRRPIPRYPRPDRGP